MKHIALIFIFLSFLLARDNPFMPVVNNIDINKTAPKKEKISKKISKIKTLEIKPFKWISFVINKSSIIIKTNDKLKKIFSIENPDKIVIDFKSKRFFATKKIDNIKSKYFENIIIGSHKNYYRIAIKLKKKVKYKLKKEDGKYIIEIVE